MRNVHGITNSGGVLVVEDDAIIRLELVSIIEMAGLALAGEAGTAADALRAAEQSQPSIALLDINLEGQNDGLEIARRLRAQFATRIVFVTGLGQDLPDGVAEFQPEAIVQKPFTTEHVVRTIRAIAGFAPDSGAG